MSGEHSLLKIGVIMMAFALALTGFAVAIMVILRGGEPEGVVASEIAAKKPPDEPLRRTAPPPVEPPRVEKERELQPVAESIPEPPPPEPAQKAAPRPKPEPRPGPQRPERRPSVLPPAEREWEKPTEKELEAVNRPRRYELPPGAILALTVDRMQIYNVPVFDSDSLEALRSGVGHVPETSLPWSETPQRNVYLAGHRMGYRGTWSRMVFYHLDKLGEGDEIVLEDRGGNRYRYRVSEVFVARPTDSWVMGQVRGRDMVTLQSCTPIPTFDKRLIVRADRV